MITKTHPYPDKSEKTDPVGPGSGLVFLGYLNKTLILASVALFISGLAWNYSTRRYLKGFSDAIVPLEGSPEQKSLALLNWLGHAPARISETANEASPRDPV